MKNLNICILGGSGFVGRSIIALLSTHVNSIKVLTRRLQSCKDLLVFPNVDVVECDIHQIGTLKTQFDGIDVIINLVGILNEKLSKGATFRKVHVELTQKVLDACATNNVPRLLHMSALNANASSGVSMYLRTKGEAENMAHTFTGSGLTVTSFQPSVIFGTHDQFFNRFAGLLKTLPYLPLTCPNSRFSPVYVGDVAQAFVNAIKDKNIQGKRVQLCGPKSYTLLQITQYIKQLQGSKKWIFAMPNGLSRVTASILQYMPGKPFTPDNYQSLQLDSVCDKGCKCQSTSVESIVPSYIGNNNEQTRLQSYRANFRN